MSELWLLEHKEPEDREWTPSIYHGGDSKEQMLQWIEWTKIRQATVEGDVTEYRIQLYRRVEVQP